MFYNPNKMLVDSDYFQQTLVEKNQEVECFAQKSKISDDAKEGKIQNLLS